MACLPFKSFQCTAVQHYQKISLAILPDCHSTLLDTVQIATLRRTQACTCCMYRISMQHSMVLPSPHLSYGQLIMFGREKERDIESCIECHQQFSATIPHPMLSHNDDRCGTPPEKILRRGGSGSNLAACGNIFADDKIPSTTFQGQRNKMNAQQMNMNCSCFTRLQGTSAKRQPRGNSKVLAVAAPERLDTRQSERVRPTSSRPLLKMVSFSIHSLIT